jgi:flavin reductase (DIM6/NTAB) family NADH-FMN oxidoreductase RutF
MEWYLERSIRVPVEGIVKALAWRDCRKKQKVV